MTKNQNNFSDSIERLWISYLNKEKIEIYNKNIDTLTVFSSQNGHYTLSDNFKNIKKIEIYNIYQFNIFIKYISHFRSIESLYIGCDAGCEMQYLPKEISILKNLKELNIQCLNTNIFPKCIKKLAKLESFIFSFTECSSEDIFSGLPKKQIKKLYLYHATYTKDEVGEEYLSEKIGNFKNLEELGLIYNETLKSLPQSIKKLKKLKKLLLHGDVVDDVVIECIPDELYELEHLEVLDLFACEYLYPLSPNFTKLKNLQEVDYRKSSIFHSPFSDEQLANLRELACQGELPDLSKCINLKILRYSGTNSIDQCFQHSHEQRNTRPYASIDLATMNLHAAPQLEELYIENGYGAEKGEILNINTVNELKKLKVCKIET